MESKRVNRRGFLKAAGAAGLGIAAAKTFGDVNEPNRPDPNAPQKQPQVKLPQVPKRKLGKTGIEVPCLALGGSNFLDSQIVLHKAVEWGVTYWDTAGSYAEGNSELGIGKFLGDNPQTRKDLFIVTKASRAKTAPEIEASLQKSLERMKTTYIDMFFGGHGMKDPADLTDQMKQWAADAKKRGVIKFFGFSTHANMAACLEAAAKLDWIDAVMTTYNYRLTQDQQMQAALDACHKAGIGLIAMKTQGMRPRPGESQQKEEDQKVGEHFLAKGYTEQQAKLKMIWADERFASVCSKMDNLAVLMSNVAAALDKTQLDDADKGILAAHAAATCSGYCAGCDQICAAAAGQGYISDVMRCLMYENSYAAPAKAREVFAQIPSSVRANLLNTDYSLAEARCPQHLPIGKLVAEAVAKFGMC